jgi:hypothetical protein
MWDTLGKTINDSFYFVVDKIIALQSFFIAQAVTIGKVVLLIAILSAGLNYALTGTNLKENIIKILKATAFFLVVIFFYPRIISFITSWTWDLAYKSIYPAVQSHFNRVVGTVEEKYSFVLGTPTGGSNTTYKTFTRTSIREITADNRGLLWNLTEKRSNYTTVAPAAVLKIVFFIAGECFTYADGESKNMMQALTQPGAISRALKGLVCGFFIIFTGVFALLEYLVCFLEFMLVASVGIILFPLSIWEGSKFMSEKFIGAVLGFFIKLLFCNIAVLLLIYGFVSLFYIIGDPKAGFTGQVDQIVFILFVCLMFLYICKSAPALAQSLLSGTPSLSATGAISAAAGAVAAVGATAGFAKGAAGLAGNVGGAVVGGAAKTALSGAGSLSEAGAAAGAVRDAGGSAADQRKAFMKSIGSDIGDSFKAGALGLTRNLLGGGQNGGGQGGTNPHSWRQDFLNTSDKDGNRQTLGEHFDKRRAEGAERGRAYAAKHNIKP